MVATISEWSVKAGPASVSNAALFDWGTNPQFKLQEAMGVYTADLAVAKAVGRRYFLDLGTVYFTAEVFVNGQRAGKRVYAPYQLDITSFLKHGQNQVEVRVTPTQRNRSQ